MRRLAGIAAMSAALAGCTCGMSPMLSTARETRCGEVPRPILSDVPMTTIAELEAASRSGLVVVAYDGCSIRILAGCRIEGGYEESTTEPVQDVASVRTLGVAESARVVGGHGTEQEIAAGRTVDSVVEIRAQRRASIPRDLEGLLAGFGCEDATHVVRTIDLGAIVVTSRDAASQAATSVAQAAGAASDDRRVLVSRGDPAGCDAPDALCNAPVSLELRPIRRDPDGPPEGPPLGEATLIEGELASGDTALNAGMWIDLYDAVVSRGGTLRVEVESDRFDTTLIVQAPSGTRLDNDDRSPNDRNSALEIPDTQAGTYRITVTSYEARGEGAYRLRVAGAVRVGPAQGTSEKIDCSTDDDCPDGASCVLAECVVQDMSELASWRTGTQAPDLGEGVVRLDPACTPGSREIWNARDDDCDGVADEGLGPGGSIEVALAWDTRVDLDLRVVDPRGNAVSSEMLDAPTGGLLDVPARGACAPGGPETGERVVWTPPTPPFGPWSVEIDVRSACGHAARTRAVFSIAVGGRLLGEYRVDLATDAHGVRVATFGVP